MLMTRCVDLLPSVIVLKRSCVVCVCLPQATVQQFATESWDDVSRNGSDDNMYLVDDKEEDICDDAKDGIVVHGFRFLVDWLQEGLTVSTCEGELRLLPQAVSRMGDCDCLLMECAQRCARSMWCA